MEGDREAGKGIEGAGEGPKNGKRRRVLAAVLVVVVLIGVFYGVRVWRYGSTHVTTDDAYLTSDVVPISARIPGNVSKVLVWDNKRVEAGELLVTLENATYASDEKQAEANLALAEAAASGAGADTGLATKTGSSEVAQAQGGVLSGESGVDVAMAGVGKARQGIETAEAVLGSTQSQYQAAQSTLEAKSAALAATSQNVKSFEALLAGARTSVLSAQAQAAASAANATTLRRQADRMLSLYMSGAVSQSDYEAADSAARTAEAQAESAKQSLESAKALVAQRQADLGSAQSQVKAAEAALRQAGADAQAALQSVNAQRTRLSQSKEELNAAEAAVKVARAQKAQNVAVLAGANALPEKIAVARANERVAQARVEQARAALESARIALQRTKLFSPVAGTVSRRNVELGQQVGPGQPLLAIIPDSAPWILANLKETQMAGVRAGLQAEVRVDAIPGVVFRGHVDSIAAGTGSVFALLPPDNASGNFTKVVQRVPVKIVLEAGQAHMDQLRAGLSVSVSIKTGG